MDKLPRPGYRIEGIPAEITRGQTSSRRVATAESTVVPFSQEDFIDQAPSQTGIDIESQKEGRDDDERRDKKNPLSTADAEGQPNLTEAIKRRALSKLSDLEGTLLAHRELCRLMRKPPPDTGIDRHVELTECFQERYEEALHVAAFLTECALPVKDFELAGIAEVMRKKAQEGIDDAKRHEDEPTDEKGEDVSDDDDYEKYLQQETQEYKKDWIDLRPGEKEALQSLGYLTDTAEPTEKAAGLFEFIHPCHIRCHLESYQRVVAGLGRGEYERRVREIVKKNEDTDWEQSEWVVCMHLGKRLDPPVPSPIMNKILEAAGYQVKIDRGWWATQKAEGLCHQEGLRAGTARILWKKEMLDRIKEHLTSKKPTG